jgi:hypothetical protein
MVETSAGHTTMITHVRVGVHYLLIPVLVLFFLDLALVGRRRGWRTALFHVVLLHHGAQIFGLVGLAVHLRARNTTQQR